MMRATMTVAVLAVLAVLASAVLAQPAGTMVNPPALGSARGQVIMSWDEFVKITGYDPAKKSTTLTIPWKTVEELLGVKVEKMGAGSVDLPWEEFKSLLEWSITKKGALDVPPPTDFIITSSQYTAVLGTETAEFTLKLKLNVLRKLGWKQVPILPTTVALTETTLPKGVYVNAAGNAYVILTDQTGELELILKFAASVQTTGGISRVNFERLQPAPAVLDLTFTGEQVDAKVSGAQLLTKKAVDKNTVVAAAIPGGIPIDITWERALPKVAEAPTKMYSETRTLIAVADGVLLGTENISLNILHKPVRELKLAVPKGVSILEVTGGSVQDWRGDQGELTVLLRGEAAGSMALRVAYEQPSAATVQLPVLRVTGVEREMGFVAVAALANVELSPAQVEGATAIDVRQLPPDIMAMTNQPILLAFRYVGDKFTIPMTIQKHPEVSVLVTVADNALFTAMQLVDGRRMTKVIYSVRNNRNQFIRLKMPAGADIWSASVSGNTVTPAKDEKGNVLIPLVRSAGARELAAFPVELVYVETPEKAPPPAGHIRVELPSADVPVLHVMFNYYLPAEGEYTVSVGLFGSRPGFSGTMRLVDDFTKMATSGAVVVQRDVAAQAAQMQQAIDAKVDAQARAAGQQPIRVQLPLKGKQFKLEKVLALPLDSLWFRVDYKGWKPAD